PASVSFPTREAQTFPSAPSNRTGQTGTTLAPAARKFLGRGDRKLDPYYRCRNRAPPTGFSLEMRHAPSRERKSLPAGAGACGLHVDAGRQELRQDCAEDCLAAAEGPLWIGHPDPGRGLRGG